MEIRSITAEEVEDFVTSMQYGFYMAPTAAQLERAPAAIGIAGLERTRAVFDEGKIVATSGIYPWELSVPGGAMVETGGVTWVTVHPTHRRRGLMSTMLRDLHAQAKEEGRPLAALWASESAIYGRLGYGIATQYTAMEIDPRRARFRSDVTEPEQIRMVERDEALKILPGLATGTLARRPGGFGMPQEWWEYRVLRVPEDGKPGHRILVSEQGGVPTGYAVYRIDGTTTFDSGATIEVTLLAGETPGAWSGLWQHILSHDLISKVKYFLMGQDDPLQSFLADPRAAQLELHDGMWVRVLDVGRALSARAYSAPLDVVFEITDPDDDMASRWRLQSDGDDSSCVPVESAPDLRIGLEGLGSIYMGRPAMVGLADAGRVDGERSVIEAVGRAFAWTPSPHCQQIF